MVKNVYIYRFFACVVVKMHNGALISKIRDKILL